MLSPKRTKYRKQMKRLRHINCKASRGNKLHFGEFALISTESNWVNSRELEASRVALTRHIKRGGKIWMRVFPDKPLTKKPAEVRMGSGKGSPELWVAEVQDGRILFEVTGVERKIAKEAMELAAAKLSVKCKFVESKETLL